MRRRRNFGGFFGACGNEIQSEILGFRPFGALRTREYTQKAGFRGIDGASGTKKNVKSRGFERTRCLRHRNTVGNLGFSAVWRPLGARIHSKSWVSGH